MSISTTIKAIQDIMRQDAGVDGDAQRISQLTWMLFLKIFDDREQEYELDSAYQSPIPAKLRWRNWAANDEGITGDELLQFVDRQLFPTLKNQEMMLASGNPRARVVYEVFTDAYNYMKSGTLLRQVINRINEIDFTSSTDRHLFNDLYEKILRDLQSAGNAGEYYTPRAVTQFMVDMTDPQLGQTVLDPACGTGGFLVCALEHIRTKYVKSDADRKRLQTSIRGIEKKPLPHLLCTTNLILHDIEVPQVIHDNALTRRPYKDYDESDQVDVILTNPPFGGMEEPGVDQNFPAQFQTKETADLFLAMIVKLLKDGGKGAVVLPDGSLFGEGVKTRLKEHLLSTCNLHTIVRLPKGVFNPYTGINTNLLFFTKGEPTQEVWYFEHPMPTDRKNYSKSRPLDIGEFDLEKAWWNERVENDHAWRVSIDEIKARNFNLDIKNPNAVDAAHTAPSVLLEKFCGHQDEIASLRAVLKIELEKTLGMDEHWNFAAEHFDLLTGAPECITFLRQSILGLAVRGKLVSQSKEDESAEITLDRINGKTGRQQTFKKDQLPLGWTWSCLQEVVKKDRHAIKRGPFGSTIKKAYFVPEGYKVYEQGNAIYRDFNRGNYFINQEKYDELSAFKVEPHDIIISCSGTVGKMAIVPDDIKPGIINQALLKVSLNEEGLLNRYFEILLPAYLMRTNTLSDLKGTAIKNITSVGVLRSLPFPLPPLAEQERIVKRVEQLLSWCDALEAQLADAERERGRLVESVLAGVGS